MSKLLINEPPLQVLPSLAKLIGLNEAIMLQQIHYWISRPGVQERDGHKWHYDTYEGWQKQFPFWSIRTLKRIVYELEKLGLIISSSLSQKMGNMTKWYTINYEKLQSLELTSNQTPSCHQSHTPSGQVGTRVVPSWHEGSAKLARSTITENETKNETERTKAIDLPDGRPSCVEQVLEDVGVGTEQAARDVVRAELKAGLPFRPNSLEIVDCEAFDMFWKLYPRRVKKPKAYLAWQKAILVTNTEVIFQAIIDQRREWQLKQDNGVWCRQWPHASTWLNEHEWDNEIQSREEIEALRPKSFAERDWEVQREARQQARAGTLEAINRLSRGGKQSES